MRAFKCMLAYLCMHVSKGKSTDYPVSLNVTSQTHINENY